MIPDGRTVVTGGENGSVAAWTSPGSSSFHGRSSGIRRINLLTTPCFVIDPQGAVMAAGQADGTVALIDIHAGS